MGLNDVFQIVQIAYWLALASWFGAVLFSVLAAPIVMRRVRETNPLLPHVLSVNLEGQHGTLLGGSVVASLHDLLLRISLPAAGVALLALVGQWFLIDLSGPGVIQPILRSALLVAAAAMLIYDWRFIWPKVGKYRQEYIDNADNPDIANPALDQFDRYQADSLAILRNMLFMLLGVLLFSAGIKPMSTILVGGS